MGSDAYSEDGIVQQAVRAIKAASPDLLLITDLCLCEYTSHGHCGVVRNNEVLNDESLELLARTAVSQAAAGADEKEDLFHAPRIGMGCSAMRAGDLCASCGRPEEPAFRARVNLRIQVLGIGGVRIEMRDGFLEPADDIGYGRDVLFSQEAVHGIADPQIDTSIPQPTDLDVDLAVVDPLQLGGQVHGSGCLRGIPYSLIV